MPDASCLIVVAQSARSLAAAARRAGYAPLAIDLFGDDDTRALCRTTETLAGGLSQGLESAALLDAVGRFVRDHDAIGLVYGSGLEDRPELVDALARSVRVLGVGAHALSLAKDPRALASVCASACVAHPEIAFEPPDRIEGWLEKTAGDSGGGHVRAAARTMADSARAYLQRRVEGRSVSALFVADGASAAVVGLSEQWTAPSARSPFRYGGAVGPIEVEASRGEEIERAVSVVVRTFGLVGLGSVDFIVSDASTWLIEVNPRPGATLDVFDCDDDPLMVRHIEACDGRMTAPAPRTAATAAQTVYAESDVTTPPRVEWPEWVADRPAGMTRFAAGDPLCTVFAAAQDPVAARRLVAERAREIRSMVEGWVT